MAEKKKKDSHTEKQDNGLRPGLAAFGVTSSPFSLLIC